MKMERFEDLQINKFTDLQIFMDLKMGIMNQEY
jgi:hypothetical protein